MKLHKRVTEFLFRPDSDAWLVLLRVGLGLHVISYSALLGNEWRALLSASSAGVIDRRLPELILRSQSVLIPQVEWVVAAGNTIGVGEQRTLEIVWALLLGAGLALVAGFCARLAGLLAWFIHLAAAKSGALFAYGADHFMTIALFYLMLAPHPDRRSLDARLWRRSVAPEYRGFFRRILQLHLCVVYFFSGVTKALGHGWWDGSNLWRALIRPPFNIVPAELVASFSYFLPPLGIAVWLVELSYPFLIWRERTRLVSLALICGIHLVIGLAMGMYLFASIMIILNAAAFGPGPLPLASAGSRPAAA
jgi:hypothetical protein